MTTSRTGHAPRLSAAMGRRADPSWFARGAEEVAVGLLGCLLVRVMEDGTRLAGRIVETEAYVGVHDRASHAFGGRRTPRNESMYAAGGRAYVYFTYGMHFCFNVVCGAAGEPVAVLVRALEPVEGVAAMRALRMARQRGGGRAPLADVDLCSGPGKVCQALAIDRSHDGTDLLTSETVFIEWESGVIPPELVRNSGRVGIEYAAEWVGAPLRWYVAGNPNVSRTKGQKSDRDT